MVLRITNEDQIEGLPPNIRAQIERSLNECGSDRFADEIVPVDGEAHGPPPGKVVRGIRKSVNRPEEDAGRMLVQWIDLLVLPNGLKPGLFFYHVPNGLARTATQGGIFKAQGLRKGWPDYCLDLPLGGYHGMRLELKAENGSKPTPEQLDILARLESVGFKCSVAWGFDDAKRQFEQYLDLIGRKTATIGGD